MASQTSVPKVEFETIAKTLIDKSIKIQESFNTAMNELVLTVQEPLSVKGHAAALSAWTDIERSINSQIKAVKGRKAKRVLNDFRRYVRNFLRYKCDKNSDKAFPKTWQALQNSVDSNNILYKKDKIKSLGIWDKKKQAFSSDVPMTKTERAEKEQAKKDEWRANNPQAETAEIPPTEELPVDTASPSITVVPESVETESPTEVLGPAYSELLSFLASQDQETQEFLSLQILEIIKSNSENITIDKIAV